MPLMTAQEIADRACGELGLPSSNIDPSIVDQIGTQSRSLMNALGDDLLRVNDWQFLEGEATITGDGVTTEFSLPADYARVVNQTVWSASDKLPGIGPVTPQTWGWLQHGLLSTSVFYRYRILSDKIAIFPTPTPGEEIKFFYIKKNWVRDQDGVTLKDQITVPSDVPLFDRSIMIAGLKLRLWGQKGFDTTILAQEFNFILEGYKSQNAGAEVVNLSGRDRGFLIDPHLNIKEGDW